MKNLLLILLISVLSASCLTVKKIEKNCDLFAAVCVTEKETDTVIRIIEKTEIEYRDTIIYVKVPGKTVIKEVPVYIENGIVNSDQSYLTAPFSFSTAQVINSRLMHELVQTDTTLRIKLENALKVVKTLEKQNKILKEKYVVTVKENKPFAKFTIKWFIGSAVLIIMLLTLAFFKYKNKILGIMK